MLLKAVHSLRSVLDSTLNFFYLQGVKLDRSVATEHADEYFDLALLSVNLIDSTVEALEGAVDNADDFADAKVDAVFRLSNTHALLDFDHFFFRNWRWLSAATNKTSDAWCVTNDIPCVFGHLHLDKDVALEDFFFDDFALAVFDLNLFFLWNHHIENLVGHVD